MKHAMIDVEALRLKQPWKAPLMQIGVVIFDESGLAYQEYEFNVDQETLPHWAEPEKGTVEFWHSQEMWPELVEKMQVGDSAEECMRLLSQVYEINCCEAAWFAGPTYDQVMLEAYFDHYGIAIPWRYNDSRDFRTIRKQHKELLESYPDNPRAHSATDDSRYQVARLRYITENTGIKWF